MPAYFDTGFSVRVPMWHGEGWVLDDYPTDWNDARKKAGLMWEPTYADLFVQRAMTLRCITCGMGYGRAHTDECPADPADGMVVLGHCLADVGATVVARALDENADLYLVHTAAHGHQAIVRNDTWDTLAVPTDKFRLITHDTMGELLDAYSAAWRKAGAQMLFETAGSCRGGRDVWALVRLDEPYTLPGDDSETYPFAALLNNHDGSGACKLVPSQIRVVCWNTYQAASMAGERTGAEVVIRHAGNVDERVEQAKQTLATVRDSAREWVQMATDLATINVDDAQVAIFTSEFIPDPAEHGVPRTDRVGENIARARGLFKSLYLEGVTIPEQHRGTGLGLVHAATEYLDHMRGFRSRDSYLGRSILRPEPLKAKAVSIVRSL